MWKNLLDVLSSFTAFRVSSTFLLIGLPSGNSFSLCPPIGLISLLFPWICNASEFGSICTFHDCVPSSLNWIINKNVKWHPSWLVWSPVALQQAPCPTAYTVICLDFASSFLAEVLHYLKGKVVSVSDVVIIFKINYISEYFYCLFFDGQELQYSLSPHPK